MLVEYISIMTNDEAERDPRDCADGECGIQDCGACQVVRSHCGDDHLTANHDESATEQEAA